MDKIKWAFHNMSLKKALLFVSVIVLSIVIVFSIITILFGSNIRQKILDSRPIIITGYTSKYPSEELNSAIVVPNEYEYGKLSEEKQLYYWLATFLMVVLPALYVVAGSIIVAKLYYRLKLQIPLNALKEGISYITNQDLDFQIQYTSDDELGKLCDTFEQMKNEIYKSNRKMWDMLEERKALTASVSHDLRTPITVITGYLDYLEKLIEKETLTKKLLQTTIQNMTRAVNRLERYVDCVKDIQKIEEIKIVKKQFNLEEFVIEIENNFSLVAKQHRKHFKVDNFTETEMIYTDRDMLLKVLENIFDNALRFSVHEIVLTVKESENAVLFMIQDDGMGFSENDLQLATSFFYSSPTNKGNYGIGLSICNILCQKLDGILCLENRKGKGANVSVQLKKV